MHKYLTFIFLIASLLAAFLVSSAVAQVRGIVPVPIKNSQGEQVGLYKGSYALVIGVSDYRGQWPSLRGVREDVRKVSATLSLQGFKVILVENPSYKDMLSALNNFISNYGLDPQNRLLFYFAGHGYTHKPNYASNDPQDWMGYFLASNSPDPKSNLGGFKEKSLSMLRIEELAQNIESKHALFIFDSCFSGSIFSLERAVPYDIEERTVKPVRQFITAGSADETVPDKSIFRRQFVSGVDGEADRNRDGYVTGSELGMFLEETVINLSRRTQTPQYGKLRHRRLNKGDFVFSLMSTGSITNSTAKISKEREILRQDRSKIKQERLAAINRLALEKQQLEQEKKSLNEEKKRAAKVQATNEIGRIVRERKRLQAEKERLAKIQPTETKTRKPILQTVDRLARLPKDDPMLKPKQYPPPKPVFKKSKARKIIMDDLKSLEVDKFSSIKEKLGSLGSKHGIRKLDIFFSLSHNSSFKNTYTVIPSVANIRSNPSMTASVIAVVEQGMYLDVIEINQDWTKIRVFEKTGWISNRLIKVNVEVLPPSNFRTKTQREILLQ